jgi:hypothetical protein
LGIESLRAAQNFGGNLVFLKGETGMIEGMFGQITQEFAERLGTMQAMTFGKLLYLLEALLPAQRESVRHSHLTGT